MKKRILIALIACLTLATSASTASAATAQQKMEAFKNCKGGFSACCRQVGGNLVTYQDKEGVTLYRCEFSDDRYGPSGSVHPEYLVEYSAVLYVP